MRLIFKFLNFFSIIYFIFYLFIIFFLNILWVINYLIVRFITLGYWIKINKLKLKPRENFLFLLTRKVSYRRFGLTLGMVNCLEENQPNSIGNNMGTFKIGCIKPKIRSKFLLVNFFLLKCLINEPYLI